MCFCVLFFSSFLIPNLGNLSESVIYLYFHFQFANPDFTVPISDIVDDVIQNCPIDVRRGLYKVSNRISLCTPAPIGWWVLGSHLSTSSNPARVFKDPVGRCKARPLHPLVSH